MQGYVKLYREILSQPISSNCLLLGFRCYLLLKANHAEKIFFLGSEKIELKPGQLVTSQKKLSTHFNVSISTINRRLKLLKKESIIEMQGHPKYTLISVLGRDKQQKVGMLTERSGNAPRMPTETNKNVKNDKNEESILSVSSLIQKLKAAAEEIDVVYNPHAEKEYGEKLLSESTFTGFCKKQNKCPVDMSSNIMRMSALINYRKGTCAGPKSIYENYAEVYNKSKQEVNDKIDEFIMKQGQFSERLMAIKKERLQKFPYKKPFTNIQHVQTFIDEIKAGRL